MNKARRAEIAEAVSQIQSAIEVLETARDEEQEFFDNMVENFQQGERGQQAEAVVDSLNDAIDSAQEAVTAAESAAE